MNNQVTTKPKLKITANKLIEKRELLLMIFMNIGYVYEQRM